MFSSIHICFMKPVILENGSKCFLKERMDYKGLDSIILTMALISFQK